jgi:N-acetylneuraminic acid mutarotase
MSVPRGEFGTAVLNDKIYVMGGFSDSTLALVEEYDPAIDSWTRKADMLSPRREVIVAAVNDKIYAIGGVSYTDPNALSYSYATEEFDPVANTWTSKASFPMDPPSSVLGNAFYAGAAANGKIYVFVYNNRTPGETATYEYDPSSDMWDKTKAPVPFGYTRYSVASLNNKLYVLTTGHPFDLVPIRFAEYDPSTDTWTNKPPPLTPLESSRLCVSGNRVYAIGGLNRTAPYVAFDTVQMFDPQLTSWDAGSPLLTARHSEGLGSVAGRIYVMGGEGSYPYPPLSAVEAGELGRRDLHTVEPCRIVDTRNNPVGPLAGPALVAGASRSFPLAGGCGIPASAAAVSINVTVTQPTHAGNLRLHPAGSPAAMASAINWSPGQTRANGTVVALGPGGLSVQCDQAGGSVHLIIDVNGYFQ